MYLLENVSFIQDKSSLYLLEYRINDSAIKKLHTKIKMLAMFTGISGIRSKINITR